MAPTPAPIVAREKKPKRPTGVVKKLSTTTLTVVQQAQREALMVLARELGYVVQRRQSLEMDLGQQIYSRMTNREGKAIFQVIVFSMSFPRQAAIQMFPDRLQLGSEEQGAISWHSESLEDARALIGNLLENISFRAYGLTRAVCPPSESVIRVWSTLMPTLEVKHAIMEHGAERLHFKGSYVLFDNSAELHAPKNDDKVEIEMCDALITALRQQVLQDVHQISEAHAPLSAHWWRQIGRDDLAAEVEAGRVTHQQRMRAAAAMERAAEIEHAAESPPALSPSPHHFEVEQILAEEPTTGAARCYYLVQWQGYDESWEAWRISGEVGEPVQTWEPLKHVRRTEAFKKWQRAKQEAAALQ